MTEGDSPIFGVQFEDGTWLIDGRGVPKWTVDMAQAERWANPYSKPIQMDDLMVATIPEAAETLIRWLDIQRLRRACFRAMLP